MLWVLIRTSSPRWIKWLSTTLYSYFMPVWGIVKTAAPRCCGQFDALLPEAERPRAMVHRAVHGRATEILKSKSVRSTNDVIDVIGTCVRQSQIVTKTNDASFSSKSVSEIGYFSNTLWSLNCWIGPKRIWVGEKAKTCLSKFDNKFLVFVYF